KKDLPVCIKIVRNDGRNQVQCTVCHKFPLVVKMHMNQKRIPAICSDKGALPSRIDYAEHFKSAVHQACLKASRTSGMLETQAFNSSKIGIQVSEDMKKTAHTV